MLPICLASLSKNGSWATPGLLWRYQERGIYRSPPNAALAIATPAPIWNHDYLVDEASVVLLRSGGNIHQLCNRHQMPFRFELLIGELYVGIFSHQSIPAPEKPIGISG